MSIHNLIITYKQITIVVLSFSLILQLIKVALTYWKHYVLLMRVISWVKFALCCIGFLVFIYFCLVF